MNTVLEQIRNTEDTKALIASMPKRELLNVLKFMKASGANMRLDKLQALTASISPDLVTNILTQNVTAELIEAYYSWPDTWKKWVQTGSSQYLDQQVLERVPQLAMVSELRDTGGEFDELNIPDAEEITYNIYGYGNVVSADLRTLRSDRLNYFDRLGKNLGLACASRLHESIYVDMLQDNPNVSDNHPLISDTYHSNDNDSSSSGVDLTYDQVVACFRLLDAMVDDANQPLSCENAYLLVGSYWREVAEQIAGNPQKPGTANNEFNAIKGRLKGVIYSRKLGYDWYLAADPRELPGLQVVFFEGKEKPGVEAESKTSSYQFLHPGTQRWRIYHYYGLVWEYWQGIVRGSTNTA